MTAAAVYTTSADAARHGWTLVAQGVQHCKLCATCQRAGRMADRYCPEGYGIAADLAHARSEERRLKDQASHQQDMLF